MRFESGREIRLFLAAVQFLTRLQVPPASFDPTWLPRSAKYFPLVGIGIGLAAAAVIVTASRIWPGPIPSILAVGAGLLLTGALHEDGLADTADGLGCTTREARLAIMTDSRLGTYGALALGLCLALRVAGLASLLPGEAAAVLVAAHAGGRLAAVLVMWQTDYAGERAAAKVAHPADRPRGREIALALAFGLAPLLTVVAGRAAPALAVGTAAAGLVAWRVCRALGGNTGDVLGAVVAIFETGFIVGASFLVARA